MPTAELARAWEREPEIRRWPEKETEPTESTENQELKTVINEARQILQYLDNWDGEGAARYSLETFERAESFLNAHSGFLRQFDFELPIPNIGAGPNGSIDLHWKSPNWELLVNIPADPTKMATFYGDNYGVQKIKGSVDPKTYNLGLAAWLIN
jgi:hypothetical protein